MLLSRYSRRKDSALSLVKRSSSSTALQKIAYHTSKVATLEPIKDAEETPAPKKSEEPIDDMGIPSVLMTVEQTRKKSHKDLEFPDLPNLPPKIDITCYPLLEKKVEICSILCDYTDIEADRKAKAWKSATLKELTTVFCSPSNLPSLNEKIINQFFGMLMANIMRGIPQIPRKYLFWNDEPLMMDIAWPHLSLVYNMLNEYQNIAPNDEHFNDRKFLAKLVSRLHAPDANERDELVKFFTTWLTNHPEKELQFMKELGYIMFEYKDGRADPFCVTPILKIMLERFRLQTKINETHVAILSKHILPLVSCPHVLSYYHLLTLIFDHFISLNPSLAASMVKRVMKSWPEAKASKQILYINLINYLVERVPLGEFERVCQRVFTLYAKCAQSNHAKVADASYQIWQNVKIIPMILDNTKIVFPVIYSTLNRAMREHWNVKAQNGALHALKGMHEIDPFTFDELAQAHKKGHAQGINPASDKSLMLHKNWAMVARAAAKTDRTVDLARVLADIQMKFNLAVQPVPQAQDNRRKSMGRPLISGTPSAPSIIHPGRGRR